MPTVILLDLSMTMSHFISDGEDIVSKRQLAINGINMLLDFFTENCLLEYISLIIFSSKYEPLVPFTRDYAEITKALINLPDYDKKIIENGLFGINQCIIKEWGIISHCNIILITDGAIGVGDSSLRNLIKSYKEAKICSNLNLTLPFKFPSSLLIVHLQSSTDDSFNEAKSLLHELLLLNKTSGDGELFSISGNLTIDTSCLLFKKLLETKFTPFIRNIKFGSLFCQIQVIPNLHKMQRHVDGKLEVFCPLEEFEICGFVSSNNASSPPFISRHLIIPYLNCQSNEETELSGMLPTLTVILHASLKIENAIAIIQIGKNWFGMLYSFADSKKKKVPTATLR